LEKTFVFGEEARKGTTATTTQSNETTFVPLLKKTLMSSAPSQDEESLSQMTASTRASFFSATSTTSTSTNSPHREQVDQSYLTPFEGSTFKLKSPFQVNPGVRATFWKYYHYYEGDTTRVCCNKCGAPIKVSNRTTGLARHLKNKHPSALEKVKKADQDNERKRAPHAGGRQPSIMGFCAL
jgi:hypothetical protein